MPTLSQCSSCSAPLPEGISNGLCPACVSSLLDSARRPRIATKKRKWPRRFGEYELLEKFGMGGMGIVYKARQPKLDRVVALKMIRRNQIGGEQEIHRFRSEAQAIARLDHPHIIPLYEVGEHRGRHFFSMLLVESGSLMTHQPRLSKDQRKSAQIMATVARAVHYAHQHGILHRDLKPANILLDAEDQPYVSDFGLAKNIDDDLSLTQTGAVLGTPSYMAPEQAVGKHGKGSPAADVYSLGAILYELLTGQPPFAAETPLATLKQLQEQDPRPPRSINRKVNRDLETICMKCLEKDPQKRYPSAEALALDLERYLRDEPIDARPIGQIAELVKWARCRPLLAGTLATAATLLIALSIGSLWAAIHFANASQIDEQKLREFVPSPHDPPIVLFMDTFVKDGIYGYGKPGVNPDETNADVLIDLLKDLPIRRERELIGANWHGEKRVITMHPDLIVIHRSAIFHAMNEEFQFEHRGKDPFPDPAKEARWQLLYRTADDKLIAFIGSVGMTNQHTRFLVYSRGTGGEWDKEEYRLKWVKDLEQRFPSFEHRNRIFTMTIEGGLEAKTFRDPSVSNGATIRKLIQKILGLPKDPPDRATTSPSH